MTDVPEGAAPQTAADGLPPSSGDAPASGVGDAATDDAAARERELARKTAASYRRGGQEREAKLLGELGLDSVESLRQIIDRHKAAEDDAAKAGADAKAADERSAIRDLQTKLRSAERLQAEAGERMKRLEKQNERARRSELHSRLMQAGAHPDAVADLVALLEPSVDWADDGDGLEVVDRSNGKVVPAGMTLDELIAEQRDKRSYMFASPARGGSGTSIRSASLPAGAPARRETWRERIAKARRGPQ